MFDLGCIKVQHGVNLQKICCKLIYKSACGTIEGQRNLYDNMEVWFVRLGFSKSTNKASWFGNQLVLWKLTQNSFKPNLFAVGISPLWALRSPSWTYQTSMFPKNYFFPPQILPQALVARNKQSNVSMGKKKTYNVFC